MEEFLAWIFNNKEWLFSGAGLVVLTCLLRFVFKKKSGSTTQTIHSGNRSTNLQAGGDINIGTGKNKSDVEQE